MIKSVRANKKEHICYKTFFKEQSSIANPSRMGMVNE